MSTCTALWRKERRSAFSLGNQVAVGVKEVRNAQVRKLRTATQSHQHIFWLVKQQREKADKHKIIHGYEPLRTEMGACADTHTYTDIFSHTDFFFLNCARFDFTFQTTRLHARTWL
jgi:hypothetical protein